jgi:hypothetical protein
LKGYPTFYLFTAAPDTRIRIWLKQKFLDPGSGSGCATLKNSPKILCFGQYLPDPVVDVDVGKTVSDEIMEEGEVKKAPLLPVLLRVREHKVKERHQDNVRS